MPCPHCSSMNVSWRKGLTTPALSKSNSFWFVILSILSKDFPIYLLLLCLSLLLTAVLLHIVSLYVSLPGMPRSSSLSTPLSFSSLSFSFISIPSFFFLFFPFLFPILSSFPLILAFLPSPLFPFRPPLFPYRSPKFLPVMTNVCTAHTYFHLIRRQTLKTDVLSYLNTLLGKRLLPSREIPKRQTFKKLIGKRRAQAKIRENPLCSWQHQNAYWPLLSAASCRNDKVKRFRTVALLDVCSLIKASRAIHR